MIQPIFKSIEALDRAGMSSIAFSSPNRKPSLAQQDFCAYLKETKNTICGRHPIGVLLGALASLETKVEWEKMKLEWLEYQQSGEVEGIKDSSVSYASGVVLKCL